MAIRNIHWRSSLASAPYFHHSPGSHRVAHPTKPLSSPNLVRPGLNFTWTGDRWGKSAPLAPAQSRLVHPCAVAYEFFAGIGLIWPQMRATREAMYLTPCRLPPYRGTRMADVSLCNSLYGPMVLAALTPEVVVLQGRLSSSSSYLTLRHCHSFLSSRPPST